MLYSRIVRVIGSDYYTKVSELKSNCVIDTWTCIQVSNEIELEVKRQSVVF